MKRVKYIAISALLAVCSLNGIAQTAKSAYFLDGTFHNFQLNPAMKAERAFFSLGLGNLSLGTKGNVGLSNFLYPMGNDKLTTFMSGSVSQDEFLGNLPDVARLGLNLDETILATGMRMFKGYTTFSVSLHSNVSMSLPKGFFEFAKKGLQQSNYSFSGINMNTTNYAAITLGHSHEIFDGFRVGVNAKYLLGLAYADVMVDKLDIELSEEQWRATSHAQAWVAALVEAQPTLDENGIISGVEFGAIAPSASGFAVDLGVVYDMKNIVPGLTLSASVVDLGKINWKYMMKGQSADGEVMFDGFDEIDPNDMQTDFNEELEKLGDDAAKMIEFAYEGAETVSTALNTTMYLGAEYNMPFYTPLSVGMLYGQRFTSSTFNKYYEVRGYLNVAPLKWFEASANFATTSYGTSWGWILNFHPARYTFFVGSDFMLTKVTPQFIPVNDLNSHITLGVNMAIGKRK